MSQPADRLLAESAAYRLTSHGLVQPGLAVECTGPQRLRTTREGQGSTERELTAKLPADCPHFHSNLPVLTVAYALAAQELFEDITPEGLMYAGANWHSVWTRDVAYAVALGGALAAPEACRRSLESRVRDGVIVQDTGTGGGWPVSTDRVSWAMGAWRYYIVTGDKGWLRYTAEVIEKTLEQDARVLPATPCLRPGETTFLDWREQSYPDRMSTADIGAAYALGTNVVHYLCRHILVHALRELGEKAEAERAEAAALAQAINDHFWNPGSRQYCMFRTPSGWRDERTDTLATALAVLSGLAGEHAAEVMRRLPRSPWGTPVFAPYKSQLPAAYHNRAVWPFVEAFVALAHAELQDTAGFAFSLSSLLRAELAFGTNKENFHAETGRAEDTLLNSDRQLWSVCGMLGAFYHGLFGLQFERGNLVIAPCVPRAYRGSHWLTGLHLRGMVIDIRLNGYGTEIAAVTVNGKPGSPIIPLTTEGRLHIEIELMPAEEETPLDAPAAGDDLPVPEWDNPTPTELRWKPAAGAESYCVYRNGRAFATTFDCFCAVSTPEFYFNRFSVQAVSAKAVSGLSKPVEFAAPGAQRLLEPHRIGEEAEYTVENGQAWLDTRPCTSRLDYAEVTLAAGTYRLRFHYCNATAGKCDGDTCALRELYADDNPVGVVLFPHNTEAGRWEDDTLSAATVLTLSGGRHRFSLRFNERCRNGNGELNQCMVRALELTRLS